MMIRTTLVALIAFSTMAKGDSYFFTLPQKPDLTQARIEGDNMHISVPLLRLPNPDVGGIEVERGEDDGFVVRTYIKEVPERGWFPMIKLEDQIIELSKVTNLGPRFASYFEIEVEERQEAVAMARSLATIFDVPEQRAAIREKKEEAEQGVAPQSATRSESDSEGDDNPQPESNPRYR